MYFLRHRETANAARKLCSCTTLVGADESQVGGPGLDLETWVFSASEVRPAAYLTPEGISYFDNSRIDAWVRGAATAGVCEMVVAILQLAGACVALIDLYPSAGL
jgi:hypothetical protein